MNHVKMSAGWQQKGTSTHKAHKYKHPETLNQKKKPVRPQASTPTHPYPTPPHPMSAAICRVLGWEEVGNQEALQSRLPGANWKISEAS